MQVILDKYNKYVCRKKVNLQYLIKSVHYIFVRDANFPMGLSGVPFLLDVLRVPFLPKWCQIMWLGVPIFENLRGGFYNFQGCPVALIIIIATNG